MVLQLKRPLFIQMPCAASSVTSYVQQVVPSIDHPMCAPARMDPPYVACPVSVIHKIPSLLRSYDATLSAVRSTRLAVHMSNMQATVGIHLSGMWLLRPRLKFQVCQRRPSVKLHIATAWASVLLHLGCVCHTPGPC
jgi:hypothetical protein